MDRFVAIQRIRRFRDLLNGELDFVQRARLRKMLVDEEDKLGASLALLDDVESEISRGDLLIARQSARVATMERGEQIGVEQARILLDCLKDSRNLHEWYRQKVLAQIGTNKVL
jgi:hypothetical protein